MSLKYSTHPPYTVQADLPTVVDISGCLNAFLCCLGRTVGHGVTCGVCESGLGGRGKSRGNGVLTLACTPGKSLEPRSLFGPCRVMLPTYQIK
jgi:hypothetical protein